MNEQVAMKILNDSIRNSIELNTIVRKNQYIANFINDSIGLAVSTIMADKEIAKFDLEEFGILLYPQISFGNVSSSDLFNLPELTLFNLYSQIASKYEMALDLGANIGLHSIIMDRAGFKKIIAVEADPSHIPNLRENLDRNEVENVQIRNQAVSDRTGRVVFSRLLGNLTGSHIKGSKETVYGEIEEIAVETFPLQDLMHSTGRIFCKMDIEGHELVAINGISKSTWHNLDLAVEISSAENAAGIFEYCQKNALHMFTEKNCWRLASVLGEIPTNWREGSALITSNVHLLEQIK